MHTYTAPTLTRIGSFKAVTKSLGWVPNDVFGVPGIPWMNETVEG